MNKRGISDLVTAILIILLVLGAVAIVWYVVRPMIGESAGQITTGAVTTDLTIIGVDATADVVTVKRNTGAGNLVGVKFVLTKSGEETKVIEKSVTGFDELETQTFDLTDDLGVATPPESLSDYAKIVVAPVLESSSGQEVTGSSSTSYNIGSGVSGSCVEVPYDCSVLSIIKTGDPGLSDCFQQGAIQDGRCGVKGYCAGPCDEGGACQVNSSACSDCATINGVSCKWETESNICHLQNDPAEGYYIYYSEQQQITFCQEGTYLRECVDNPTLADCSSATQQDCGTGSYSHCQWT